MSDDSVIAGLRRNAESFRADAEEQPTHARRSWFVLRAAQLNAAAEMVAAGVSLQSVAMLVDAPDLVSLRAEIWRLSPGGSVSNRSDGC